VSRVFEHSHFLLNSNDNFKTKYYHLLNDKTVSEREKDLVHLCNQAWHNYNRIAACLINVCEEADQLEAQVQLLRDMVMEKENK